MHVWYTFYYQSITSIVATCLVRKKIHKYEATVVISSRQIMKPKCMSIICGKTKTVLYYFDGNSLCVINQCFKSSCLSFLLFSLYRVNFDDAKRSQTDLLLNLHMNASEKMRNLEMTCWHYFVLLLYDYFHFWFGFI